LRVVAATNQDLDSLVTSGRFRPDLYFRLNVTRVELPPLRERREDVPVLIDHYVRHYNQRFDRQVEGLTDESMTVLLAHHWPGNVRELRNVIEAMFVAQPADRLAVSDLPARIRISVAGGGQLRDRPDPLLEAVDRPPREKRT